MAESETTERKPNLPFTVKLKLLVLALAKFLYIRRDGTINRRIQNLFDRKRSAPATKRINGATVSTSDISIDTSRGLWLRLFNPSTTMEHKLPLIVYFHGGGFNTFRSDSQFYDELCCQLAAKAHAVVVSIDYRLAPEHRYPSQYDDSFDALKFIDLRENSGILPAETDLERCFIAGDSAGGNIAHHVTVRACRNPRELKNLKILGVLLVQPFFGGEERTEAELRLDKVSPILDLKKTDWMWRMFLPEGSDRDHRAVNVWKYPEAVKEMKAVEFPAAVVVVGGYDPLQDWQRRYVEGLKECGKEVEVIDYPSAFHSFYFFPEVTEFDPFVSALAMFIRKQSRD